MKTKLQILLFYFFRWDFKTPSWKCRYILDAKWMLLYSGNSCNGLRSHRPSAIGHLASSSSSSPIWVWPASRVKWAMQQQVLVIKLSDKKFNRIRYPEALLKGQYFNHWKNFFFKLHVHFCPCPVTSLKTVYSFLHGADKNIGVANRLTRVFGWHHWN